MSLATRDYRRHGFPRKTPARLGPWLLAIVIAAALFAIWSHTSRDEQRERAIAAIPAPATTPARQMQVSFDICPAHREPGDTLIFVIKTSADGINRVEGCNRIAANPYRAQSRSTRTEGP